MDCTFLSVSTAETFLILDVSNFFVKILKFLGDKTFAAF
jgi:hypothetical protein